MTKFYCIRHGKTEFNAKEIFQGGGADSPLLKEGKEGARLVGKFLKDVPFTRAFTSPQKRAVDTANLIVKEHATPVEISLMNGLRELHFGDWDGQPEKNFHQHPEFIKMRNTPDLFEPSTINGESFQEVIQRGTKAFSEIAKMYPKDNILLVSHGLFLFTLLNHFQGFALSDLSKSPSFIDNTSVTILATCDKGKSYQIEDWNNTSFL